MNIGFDARLYGTFDRGLGRYNEALLQNLAQLDQVNKYWLFGNRDKLAKLPAAWVKSSAPWRVYSFGEQVQLPKLIKKYPIDIVHWPHFNVPLGFRQPYVVTIHDMIVHQFPNERATTLPRTLYRFKWHLYNTVFKSAVKKARAVIAVSQTTKDILCDYYPELENKIKVIYEAPTIDGRVYKKVNRVIAEPYLLYVGAAYPHKNLKVLINAFNHLRQEWPELKLVLVGRIDFFYERLRQELLLNNTGKSVVFWGEATEDSLASLYAGAELYVTPSLAEGFNLTALEALSFYCPVVASDIPVHREVLGPSATFADAKSEMDLAEVIKEVLTKRRAGSDSLPHAPSVLSRYSWQLAAQETLDIYHQALSNSLTTHTI